MKITSFDGDSDNKIKRDTNQDGLFNLFQKNIVNTNNIKLEPYFVPREFEMRLDRVSKFLYGTSNYVEELMVLNDIINPYSIKEGQLIYFCSINSIVNLYKKDELIGDEEASKKRLVNSSQAKTKQKFINDQNLAPTIKPSNLKQVKVKDNRVEIINTFQ
jgi:hypothetical protein